MLLFLSLYILTNLIINLFSIRYFYLKYYYFFFTKSLIIYKIIVILIIICGVFIWQIKILVKIFKNILKHYTEKIV